MFIVHVFKSFSTFFPLQGLDTTNTKPVPCICSLSETSSKRTSSYSFSMANLEETHEADLDAILGELSILEQCIRPNNTSGVASYLARSPIENIQIAGIVDMVRCHESTHRRSNSIISSVTSASVSSSSESGTGSGLDSYGPLVQSRTDSPDNDSAFSDTVSLMSSASSSASSGLSNSIRRKNVLPLHSNSLHVRGEKILYFIIFLCAFSNFFTV